jgi:hypothetical protein
VTAGWALAGAAWFIRGARVLVGGEDFGHGEPGGGGHLFFGAAAEGVEVKRLSPGTDEVEAFDAGF